MEAAEKWTTLFAQNRGSIVCVFLMELSSRPNIYGSRMFNWLIVEKSMNDKIKRPSVVPRFSQKYIT